MTTVNIRRLKIMTYLGLLCLVIAWTTIFYGIVLLTPGIPNQSEFKYTKAIFRHFSV